MTRLAIAFLLGAFVLTAHSAETQQKPSAEEMKQVMESSMSAMAPMMGKMSEAMIEAQLAAAVKPETARRIAQFKKNLYDELRKEGFSKSEALAILESTPIPAGYSGQK
jgi:hypothetical protein